MDLRRNTATAGALVLVSCLVQAWMISRAVVPAQDSVRYLIVAQSFERDGLVSTLRTQPEQPLFPAVVWLLHRALPVSSWVKADNWAISMQVAAAIALVLSVVPVYLLFCKLHGEWAALVGTLFYCLLGGIARFGADGLSDSTHLALFMLALWCVAEYFAVERQISAAGWLLACGIFTGLALMARSESLVLPAALLATLALLALRGVTQQAWKTAAVAAATFVLGLAAVLVPYLASCGAVTPTAALARLAGRGGAAEAAPLNDCQAGVQATAVEPRWELPGIGRLAFGKKDVSTSSRFRGYLSAGCKLFQELAQTLHYWVGILALIGLWAARRRLVSPLDRFMQCLCATLVVAGVAVAAQAGYLSTRHVLLLVVLGAGWAGYGCLAVADWLARLLVRFPVQPYRSSPAIFCRERPPWRSANSELTPLTGSRNATEGVPYRAETRRRALITVMLTVAAVVACATDCLAPLHASREAHRQAARWLMEHADRSAAVLDSRGWTALYTGRKTYRYEAAQAAFCDPTLAFVVVERAELKANSRRGETMRLLMGHAGEQVARFAAAGSEKHSVVVYRWRPERFEQLGVQTYAR